MKYEKALKVYNEVQAQLKTDPTAVIPGEYIQAEGVLRDAGFFNVKEEEAPVEVVEEPQTQEIEVEVEGEEND